MRLLIVAAIRLGGRRVAEMVMSWRDGSPLRTRRCALLKGATVEKPIECSGMTIEQLPSNSESLPSWVPVSAFYPVVNYLGRVVMAVECTHRPALYRPMEDEARLLDPRRLKTTVMERIPNFSFDKICESIALASGHFVECEGAWEDLGDLNAFRNGVAIIRAGPHSAGGVEEAAITEAHVFDAFDIFAKRHGSVELSKGLELAISRWVKSKRPSVENK